MSAADRAEQTSLANRRRTALALRARIVLGCASGQETKRLFDPRGLHHPLAPHDDLRGQMVWREQRTVTKALTLHYNNALFILEPSEFSRPLAGKRVGVCEYPDGQLEIRSGPNALPYGMFNEIRQVKLAAIVDNMHLDAALILPKLLQEQLPARKRNNNEPCRSSQPTHMFPVPERPDIAARGGETPSGELMIGPAADAAGPGCLTATPARHSRGCMTQTCRDLSMSGSVARQT